MVTAYDAPSARIADAAGVELILVGDSAAMVVLGYDSTVPASMDEMLMLTAAAVRGAKRPIVVADMPFGSFQVSDEHALEHAVRFVKEAAPTPSSWKAPVRRSPGAGDRRCRHPRDGPHRADAASATALGGFKAQGRTAAKARTLVDDARALEAAGCFAVVLEAVPAAVAAEVTRRLSIPTIGIGAGSDCDGQVLVWHDLLGLYEAGRRGSSATRGRRRTARALERYAENAARRLPSSSTRTRCRRRAARVHGGGRPGMRTRTKRELIV